MDIEWRSEPLGGVPSRAIENEDGLDLRAECLRKVCRGLDRIHDAARGAGCVTLYAAAPMVGAIGGWGRRTRLIHSERLLFVRLHRLCTDPARTPPADRLHVALGHRRDDDSVEAARGHGSRAT